MPIQCQEPCQCYSFMITFPVFIGVGKQLMAGSLYIVFKITGCLKLIFNKFFTFSLHNGQLRAWNIVKQLSFVEESQTLCWPLDVFIFYEFFCVIEEYFLYIVRYTDKPHIISCCEVLHIYMITCFISLITIFFILLILLSIKKNITCKSSYCK